MTELVPIDQGLSLKIVLITNLQTGRVRNFKPFLMSGMSFFVFFFLLYLKNQEFLSVECALSLFSLDERSVTPSLIRSTQLMTFSIAGTQAALCGELCFLCLQYGVSHYYTTASASPATTNIPTTTAVSTTVKSSVLVGNQQS